MLALIWSWRYLLLYILLFSATTFVNKYVLSVLTFQYPTIFQGWQTLVGAVSLRLLSVPGKVEIGGAELTRREVLKWCPGLVLFVISIYSGSKALSKIPIPTFLALQNLTDFSHVITDTITHKRTISLGKYVSLMYIAFSSIMISWTDPQFHESGYVWMMIHILTTGTVSMYSKISKYFHLVEISDTGKLYYNYLYSFIILAPSSYFIGDALAAREFPFFYFYKFYVGCVSSGLFGVMLSLIVIKYKEEYHTSFRATAALAKVVASVISVGLFDFLMTASNIFWIFSNQLASLAISLLEQADAQAMENTDGDYKAKQNGALGDTTII